MKILAKMVGDGAALPPKHSLRDVLLAGLGGVLAIGCVGLLMLTSNTLLVLGSFGASCVLLFGFPDVPFSQPRNLVAGHFFSSLIGLVYLALCGPTWWGMALAAGTAIMFMIATRTVHPPAGSNPVIVFLARPGWDFLVFPTLLGSLVILAIALLYLNAAREKRYPKYWLGSSA